MEQEYKEVRFDIYCQKCVHKDLDEVKDPCNECLDEPYNYQSEKPVMFKEEE